MPNHSTPIGLADALPRCCQEWVSTPGSKPRAVATVASFACRPGHQPTAFRPSSDSGRNPNTIRKNCRTSL